MSGGTNRLPEPAGSRIDRGRAIRFGFEGQEYEGFAGDTIASALAANGVWLLSRSFKYHRPRGSMTMAGEDGSALVQVGDEPNVFADTRPIEPGMSVTAQNYFGSLEWDVASLIERFKWLFPVGFYYKAFYRPRGIWNYWEKLIRQTAGLGRVAPATPRRYFDKAYLFCDVAVVGAGPAGMAAALEAAKSGAEVLLVERDPQVGGSMSYVRSAPNGNHDEQALDDFQEQLSTFENLRMMADATCTGLFTDNLLSLVRGNRLYKLRAKSVVVCAGALGQPATFRSNDLPGIVMGTAAQRLINHYGVKPGRRAVMLTSDDDGYGVALDLDDSGVEVAAILDTRRGAATGPMASHAAERGIRVLVGTTVHEATPRPDKLHLSAVLTEQATDAKGMRERIDCDLLCISVGSTPNASLLCQSGAKLKMTDETGSFAVRAIPPGVFAAGSVNGFTEIDAAVADGRRAGGESAQHAGFDVLEIPRAPTPGRVESQYWLGPGHPHGLDFVDFDEDLTVGDIKRGIAEGFEDVELVKRYTAAGMGPSQGRHSALATSRLVAQVTGRRLADVGATTMRPPAYPEKFGHLAGRGFNPVRHTPLQHRHLEAGAQVMVAGLWVRPAFYGPRHRRSESINDEVRAVRQRVGLIDVSTLGGFEIRGPDAGEFLNRIYTLSYDRLRVGRVRYAMMIDDTGVVVDDGVAARLGRNHYYVTASTSGAEQLYPSLLWRQAQWRLDVDISDVTPAYCGLNIAGPASRAVLQTLESDIGFSREDFPYMTVRTGQLVGIHVRILRIGFVGELGYEIHAPSSNAEALWDALSDAGRPFGLRFFGLEAQRVLRLEKGHIIVGQDTDGLTSPLEAGMEWALGRRKRYYVGKRTLDILARKTLTRSLVGYQLSDTEGRIPEEGHLVVRGREIVGRVTSSAWSPTLGRPIGMAYVAPEQAKPGETVQIKVQDGRLLHARVVPLPFYDALNARQEL